MLNYFTRIVREHIYLSIAVALTFLIYSRFLFYGHISWDDGEMVFKNQAVQSFDLRSLFTNHYVGNYIPITMVFHSLFWFFFESSDLGHHLMNILIHLLNGVLVYSLSELLFRNRTLSLTAAILFLVHPIQIESVGWISELKNLLSTTFFLAALIQYVKFKNESRKKLYVFSFVLFILACLSKSSAVVLPVCLIFADLFINKGFSWKSLINKIPFLAFSLFFGWINIQTQAADQFINHAHEFPYWQRAGFAGYAIIKYLALFLLPYNLSVIYPYPEASHLVFALGFFMIATILFLLTWWLLKKNYQWVFILMFILVNLALVLQFLPFGEVLYADRYLYVPIVGFGWIAGTLISRLKIPSAFVCAGLIGIYGILSFARAGNWKSAIVLYEDILKKYPDQFVALNSAGVESMFLNNDTKALTYFDRAIKVAPRNYKGFYNRGLLLLKNNKPKQAIASFNETLNLYDYAKAYTGRASAYYMLGDLPKAINDAELALERDKNNARAHFVLGNCYNDMNQLNKALAEYNQCIQLNQNEADFYFKRAIVYGKQQKFRDCLNDLSICLYYNPYYYEAYYWQGVAKVNLGENPCSDFQVAARNNYQPAIDAYNKHCR